MTMQTYLRELEAGAMWDMPVFQHLSKAMGGGVVRLWAPHWGEPLEIRWGDNDVEDLTVEVLNLAWVHDDIHGPLNHLHVIGKSSVPPEPRRPEEDAFAEEEVVLLEEEEEETAEEAEEKARQRQEWERIREELQDAKVWEWETRRKPIIARHLQKMVEQKEWTEEVAKIAGGKMLLTDFDEDGNDNGVTGFDKDTWLTDHVINTTMRVISQVRGYWHGKEAPKI